MIIVRAVTDSARYRPNSPPILHETIDHETIIVNLDIGTYYSLNPAGTSVWLGLDDGASLEQVVRELAAQSGAPAGEVDKAVRVFVEQLLGEDLIIPRDGGGNGGGIAWPDGRRFEAPIMSSYTDMQELLLLDPVHDLGVGDWPQAP